jgi:flavodoxin
MVEMKTLLVVYSRTGITKTVAKQIASKLNADIEELVDMKKRTGWWGYLRAGSDAVRKKKTTITQIKYNPESYECIILGTPVWAGTFVPALRTYINEHKDILSNKKLFFLATMGAKEPQNAFIDIEKLIGKKPRATLALQAKRVRRKVIDQPLNQFIKHIRENEK